MRVDLTLIESIHDSISRKSTGCPSCMCKKFNVSERSLYGYLKEMKIRWAAPIDYCHTRKTYYYTRDFDLYFGDLSNVKAKLVKEILATINSTLKFVVLLQFVWF